jgi:hypothetical protein
MRKPTVWNALFALTALLALTAAPIPALAQHGGGHGGGGGGGHAGGGFSGGGHSGGSFGGGYHGGGSSYSGGRGFAGGGRSYGGGSRGMSSSMRGSGSAHAWASEGHGVRNTSPGWHGFERSGNSGGMAARSGGAGMAARSGRAGLTGRSAAGSHAAIADGAWHSFGGVHSGSVLASNASFNGGRFGFNSFAFRGGFAGRGFWGYPGFGCCGWGLGFGWGWGWGWGLWDPFWTWPSYWYSPWVYGATPEYIYPNP